MVLNNETDFSKKEWRRIIKLAHLRKLWENRIASCIIVCILFSAGCSIQNESEGILDLQSEKISGQNDLVDKDCCNNSYDDYDEEDIITIEQQYYHLESILIPRISHDRVDFGSMNIEDYQYIAYLLKAESRRDERKQIVNDLTNYLVDHADDNKDGEIGWGLNYEWDAFGDGTVNPGGLPYTIITVNVLDGYLAALGSGYLESDISEEVKNQIRDIVLIWNRKYWSESNDTDRFFYWYSISDNDEKGCINIDAKMAGTQARILREYSYLFNEDEKNLVLNHIDTTYNKVIEESFVCNEAIVWHYLEEDDSNNPGDVIHHSFILEGITDYSLYRMDEHEQDDKSDYNEYTGFIKSCISNGIIYSNHYHTSNRCFDTGAIQWCDFDEQGKLLISSYDLYVSKDTDNRQLAFLLDSMSKYLSKISR